MLLRVIYSMFVGNNLTMIKKRSDLSHDEISTMAKTKSNYKLWDVTEPLMHRHADTHTLMYEVIQI